MSIIAAAAIARLTPQERLSLIEALWDSLTDADLPSPAAQADELLRRLARFGADKPQAIAWTDLRTDIAARTP